MANCKNQCSGSSSNGSYADVSLCDVFILAPWFRYTYFFFVWFGLVWFVLLRWFVFSSVFRNKYSMAYSAIQTIHHAVKLIFVAQNTLAHTHTKSAMSWKYWNLFTKREKSIKEEEQEEQAKVEYFRFREKHTHAHISHTTHTRAYYYEPTKRLFTTYYTKIRTQLLRVMILFCVA